MKLETTRQENGASVVENQSSSPFQNKKFLAERYKVTTRTIERWMKLGILPFSKLGHRTVRFNVAACDAALMGVAQ
jgi:hypothetical protein